MLELEDERMSTRVNIPVARRGCVVVSLLRLGATAFRLVGATSFGCCVWYQLVDCVCVSAGCSADVDVNAGQHSCCSKRMRRRFVVATGSPAASFYQSLRDFSQGREAIPHSHLPAAIVVTMRRVVNYHSSWARHTGVELIDASVSWRVAYYHTVNTPRGHCLLLVILGAMFEFLSSLVGRTFHCSSASHA
ncbi:hypothetical protein F511_35581 [Dorcoceras hygrometricum]|uniref:Uncharacterized protein n=1 Tax=Dorcoceras hygrometricum TaxID=472368 RepID=A0A2Z7BYI0_9LAMI|nr:hypothetical protein F511_35581 [Dorcoceras hygrometricum]